MHPPTKGEFESLADLQERIEFALRMGNHIAHARVQARAEAPPPAWRGMPTTGARKAFALLIEFEDSRHHNEAPAIHAGLFGRGGSGSPHDSLAAYYDRSSYHQLDLYGGTTLDWYRTKYPRKAVKRSNAGRDRLIKEALTHFHAQGHDFRQYDTDGDGVVDYFLVIWAATSNGWGSFWWPYSAQFSDPRFTLNGVKFGPYAWTWESERPGAPFDVSAAIHETGHGLGIPDYYDYKPKKGPRGGLGGMDPMDQEQFDHNCFSKLLVDWIKPTIVTKGSHLITLRPSSSSRGPRSAGIRRVASAACDRSSPPTTASCKDASLSRNSMVKSIAM